MERKIMEDFDFSALIEADKALEKALREQALAVSKAASKRIEEIEALQSQGASLAMIAKALGMSHQAVSLALARGRKRRARANETG